MSPKRLLGEVYEFPYRCGHLKQHTLIIPTAGEPDVVTLNRVVEATEKRDCPMCDHRNRTGEVDV
jgi:hypothetical protein